MWLICLFRKKIAAAGLSSRLSLKARSSHGSVNGGMLTSYMLVVNYILGTNATEDLIAETDTEIVSFT